MRARILAAVATISSACTGTVSASPVVSAVFTGSASAVVSVYDSETAYLTAAGSAMADISRSYCGGWYAPNWPSDPTQICLYWVNQQAIATVSLTGSPVPMIDIMGSAVDAVSAGSMGSISYFVRLDREVADAPDVAVPIQIAGSGSLSARRLGVDGNAYASASLTYRGPGDADYQYLYWAWVGYNDPDLGFTYNATRSLRPGSMVELRMRVEGGIGQQCSIYGCNLVSGGYQGLLDPSVVIAPDFLVSYNGELVSAASLYSLAFSPEIGATGDSVPEASSLLLTGGGLLVLGALRGRSGGRIVRRRNRRSPSATPASV